MYSGFLLCRVYDEVMYLITMWKLHFVIWMPLLEAFACNNVGYGPHYEYQALFFVGNVGAIIGIPFLLLS
jgi:hypothetical protein